jgi:hypothetical protein
MFDTFNKAFGAVRQKAMEMPRTQPRPAIGPGIGGMVKGMSGIARGMAPGQSLQKPFDPMVQSASPDMAPTEPTMEGPQGNSGLYELLMQRMGGTPFAGMFGRRR